MYNNKQYIIPLYYDCYIKMYLKNWTTVLSMKVFYLIFVIMFNVCTATLSGIMLVG